MSVDIKITKNYTSKLEKVDFKNLDFGSSFTDHMFICDYKNGEWQDARIVPFDNMSMHPASFILHYAQSIFEGLKAELSKDGSTILIYRPDKNAKRFQKSADRLAMPIVPEELFLKAIDTLIQIDIKWIPKEIETSSLYIRPFLFGNDPILGVKVGENYRFVVIMGPVGAYYTTPVKVWIQKKYTRAFEGGTGNVKFAGNYSATLHPVKEAYKKGCQQILWTGGDKKNIFQEVGTMNIFFVINKILITPSLIHETVLEGVTRDSIIQLAKADGIVVEERDITIEELVEAVESKTLNDMFGSGTAAVIQNIDGFVLEDKEYNLEWMDKEFSKKYYQKITNIKRGIENDNFGWLRKIKVISQSN